MIIFYSYLTGAVIEIPTNSARRVTARIYQRVFLECSVFSDQEGVTDIDWYRCSTNDCDGKWNKNWIAQVQNMRNTDVVNSSFEVYTNGTLVIERVLPVDDEKLFICVAHRKHVERKQSNTIISVAKEKPQLILESSTTLHVMEGKDLHLNARVQGYPFPRVTWSHHGHLLKDTSNVHSETSLKIPNVKVSERGLYTCYAENPFGNDSLIVNVRVEDQPLTTTTESDQPVTAATESDQPVTAATESGGSSSTGGFIAAIVFAVLLSVVLIIFCLPIKYRRAIIVQLKGLLRRCVSRR
ncbi:Immunoglobulin superfamily member 10 [Stylophora pistillata]|uniref:Immunoglobulin superfamily member 10 n=1 Tax=Stylophora pistillata TaxID=50429 RepID=A0A2B4RAR7_STYPI|nr:Immunoglobulin superfamily member 10 [Stylophora pistillata]